MGWLGEQRGIEQRCCGPCGRELQAKGLTVGPTRQGEGEGGF
jgi:hypothetical protein